MQSTWLTKLINEVNVYLKKLKSLGFYITDDFIEKVSKIAGEL